MNVVSFITDNGIPATDLTRFPPIIRILDINSSSVVIDSTMCELGDGFYTYDFRDFNSSKEYAIRVDGRGQLSNFDRWAYFGNEDPADLRIEILNIVNSILDETVDSTTHFGLNTVGEALTVIKGLVQHNFLLDNTIYNSAGLLIGSRIRIFGNRGDVQSAINPIATFEVASSAEASPNDNKVQSYKVMRIS